MADQFLVLGLGSIGMRHIRNLLHVNAASVIYGFDPNTEQASRAVQEFSSLKLACTTEDKLSDFLNSQVGKFTAVFICTPTAYHAAQIRQLISMGWQNMFVEKPLCIANSELNEIVKLVDRSQTKMMVGCNFRYNEGLIFLKQLLASGSPVAKVASVHAEFGYYLPRWRPNRNYKENYSASKELGGGVLFDRIHELDYLSYLFGPVKEIAGFVAKNSSLPINVEDTAEVICQFKSGILGHIHVDYVSPFYVCRLKIVGEDGILEWNFNHSEVVLRRSREDSPEILFSESDHDVNQMYVRELKDFLNFIYSKDRSYDEFFRDAVHVTEKLLEVKESNLVKGVS